MLRKGIKLIWVNVIYLLCNLKYYANFDNILTKIKNERYDGTK